LFIFILLIWWNRCSEKICIAENGNTKEHDEFYKMIGISRENIWIQKSPPGSELPDMQIVSMETNDPANVSKNLLHQIFLGQ
jgi:hypothetical protein